jgi:hypothetical protein
MFKNSVHTSAAPHCVMIAKNEQLLFAKPLPSNGCCIFAHVVVAQQWLYMPQYFGM